ncbi:MAG: sigma-54-dependent Fis family transcriptional regulator [Candidatus Binataceae bacterium]|nr:sigma-54-dependent Fis family transcriptional regulator [Candidatus Binataceae bacterium]
MTIEPATILVVDDDREVTSMLSDILSGAGYRTLSASSGNEALQLVRNQNPDLLITDLRMTGMSGHQLQVEMKKIAPAVPTVIITAFGSIQTAVESMKLGAFDYITKPFSNQDLMLMVSRALEDRKLRLEVRLLRGELARSYGLDNIIAANPKMLEILDQLQLVAQNDASVLIRGESGTGKDLLARAIHFMSAQRDGAFVPVNCAAIPETLLESELFGYVRGAFTDARQPKTGLFESASSGTLFLDEIGELSPAVQAKLLRAIEDKMIRPLGATAETQVIVRIITATNADLEKMLQQGRFRTDLYYRLAAVTLTIPPLRERPEDIPLLIKHFIARAAAQAGRPVPLIEAEAMDALLRYPWPGNVRELQNAIQHTIILMREGSVRRRDLPAKIAGDTDSPSGMIDQAVSRRITMDQLEREYVRAVLTSVGGNKSEAASILQIDRKTLYRRLQDEDQS